MTPILSATLLRTQSDARLVAFAKSLARAQFLVLVPDIANTRALKVSAADSAFIGDAIEELAQRVAGGGEPSIGLVAIRPMRRP